MCVGGRDEVAPQVEPQPIMGEGGQKGELAPVWCSEGTGECGKWLFCTLTLLGSNCNQIVKNKLRR